MNAFTTIRNFGALFQRQNARSKRAKSSQPKMAAGSTWQRTGFNTGLEISIFCTYFNILWHFQALAISLASNLASNLASKPLRFKIFREIKKVHLEAPGWGRQKMTTQSRRQRAAKALAKNIDFPCIICIFCSSGSIWWPLPASLSCSKSTKQY